MRYDEIRRSDIQSLEKSLGVREGKFINNLARIEKSIQIHVHDVRTQLKGEAPESTVGDRITDEIIQRVKHFREHGHILP